MPGDILRDMKFLLVLAMASAACAQTSLHGVVDIHVHSDPDSRPRSIDAIDLAKMAKTRGMRALVLKSHYEPTASMAYLVRKAVPGIEIFGGIDLNRSVGGVNPEAVERMAAIKGGWGRVVWMPTFDAENQVRFSKENRPFVSVAKGGQLLPEVKQVIALAAKLKLTLETGHSSPEEGLLILREAKRQGVARMVVTHAMLAPVGMSIAQMREAAGLGAYLEFVYNGLIGPNREFQIADYVKAIHEVGAKFCIVSSDLGQVGNPIHPDGFAAFLDALAKAGVSAADIGWMARKNPALVVGLSE
jgi:hypothetical protein